MINRKNRIRKMYEKFNLYIYFFIPIAIILLYLLGYLIGNLNLIYIKTYNQYKIEISIAITGILLTIMGLFVSLPNTEFKKLMKKYNHDKIINRTLFIGVISSILVVILSVIEQLEWVQSILFIIAITEMMVATVWIYKTLTYVNS